MPDVVIISQPVNVVRLTQANTTVAVTTPGPQGPQGETGAGGARFEHIQALASSEWIINHDLGYYPVAQVIIDGNATGDTPRHTSINSFSIDFASPQTGRVEYL